MMEWIPSEEEYNPGVTKEQWIEFVQDNNIFNENSLITFACIQKAKVATCADMAEDFGRNANFYNSNVWRTGERIYKKINCPLSEREEGGNRFWSVCCLGRDLKNGRFEFKIRPELQEAFDVTGVLEGIEVMEKKTSFTWIPFYTEMAEKLLEYKDNRKELVKIVYGMDEEDVRFFKDDRKNNFKDLHPFALYGIFNRQILPYKKIRICTYLKDKLQIKSDIPSDFDGLPTVNNQNSWWGMPWTKNDAKEDININWKLFEISQRIDIDNKNFRDSFDFVLSRGGTKRSLTMALFWIRPYEFMPLDANSREYLQKIGINVFDEKELNGQNYLDLCELIKDKIANNEIKEKSIPEISNNAWLKEPQGDTQMTQEDTLVSKYTDLLRNTKNIILTGAPGTGKTFMAKTVAARIILEREINDFDKDLTEEEKKQVESQAGFVQFHPSYDYTDFVEGLRPTDKDGNVGFERRDGVFKKFCAKALEISKDEIDKFFDEDHELDVKGEKKCFKVKKINENSFTIIDTEKKYNNFSGNKDEFSNYCNNPYSLATNKVVQKLIYDKIRAMIINRKNFVFIIDEINRGEVAKVFGELFYCVDPGYRGEKGWIKTQYANLETEGNEFDKALGTSDFGHFFIPENVYIIGTMNDIDRSVESMDFAFRRRFSWIEVKASDTVDILDPKYDDNGELIAGLEKDLAEKAKRRMENLNAAIWDEKENKGIEGLNDAYHIGASYFLKLKNYGGDFESLWEYHLKGILQEYLRGSGNEAKIAELKAAYDKEEEN